jgi:predicted PurR-regulated permease PerM
MTLRLVALRAAVALGIVLLALALWQMREAAQLLAIAVAVSAGLAPLVSRLVDRGVPRGRAAAVVFGLTLLLIGLLAVGLALLLAGDLALLVDRLPGLYEQGRAWLSAQSGLLATAAARTPDSAELTAILVGDSGTLGQAILDAGIRILALTALAIGAAALGFYWLVDEQRIMRLWLSLLPLDVRTRVRATGSAVYREVGIYVRGVAVVAALTTAALLVVYRLAEVPGGAALALAGGLAQVVPLLGPILALLPGALVALSQGELTAAAVLAASTAALAVIKLGLAPRLLRRGIGVNPVLVVVLIMALAEVGGVPLILLAPPMAAALQAATRALVGAGRDEAARTQATRLAELEHRLEEVAEASAASPDNLRLRSLVDRARALLEQARQAGAAGS